MAWPNTENIEKIYFLTGQKYSSDVLEKYKDDFTTGEILVTVYNNESTCCITPNFISKFNNFKENLPLVYGAFCFSDLGDWPKIMTINTGASGYFGYDWSVRTNWSTWWNKMLIQYLCDTNYPYITTTFSWMNNFISKDYWDEEDLKIVRIRYYGDSDLSLRESADLYNTCDISIQYVGTYYNQEDSNYISTKDYLKMSNARIPGSFTGNTFMGIYDNLDSENPMKDNITIVFSDDFSVIESVYWSKSYKSSFWGVKEEKLNFSAENIPLHENFSPLYWDVEYRILGEETCNSFISLSHQWVEDENNWIHTLDSYECNTSSMIKIRMDKE
jgi:hypothetical protein